MEELNILENDAENQGNVDDSDIIDDKFIGRP